MKDFYCVHVSRGDSRASSRIQLQLSWLAGTVIDNTQRNLLSALMSALKRAPSVVIFHGQSTLPHLLFCSLIKLLSRSSFRIVYDMHDLNERPLTPTFRSNLRYYVFYFFEYLIARMDVGVITVSKGLSRIFFKRFGRSTKIVYNVSFEVNEDEIPSEKGNTFNLREGVVYFGLLEPGRIPIELAREIFEKSMNPIFDVYGRVPKGTSFEYSALLSQLSETTSLRIIGPYDPAAMGFLNKYSFSWLCFESDRLNIRYCMPNKLFQSLSAGLCCVISDRLVEARAMFGDACLSYRDFLGVCEGRIDSPVDRINWSDVNARMQGLADRSRMEFLEACGCTTKNQ